MRIACLGAGPAGLYFAILMKQAAPDHDVTVIERNRNHQPSGWGIVFSDSTLDALRQADAETHAEISAAFHHWDKIHILFRGEEIVSHGHGFAGIARPRLLHILQQRAMALDVNLQFETEAKNPDIYSDSFDLVVAADGINSATRQHHAAAFKPTLQLGKCRFLWLGTRRKLDAFTFAFKETQWGWFNLHAYRFDDELSTFIVETPEQTWQQAGLDKMTLAESITFCEAQFAEVLDGETLRGDPRGGAALSWQRFQRVLCEHWHYRNIVLIGDAAHTAHFSIGSGTKMAMEDAICLSKVLSDAQSCQMALPQALKNYQDLRQAEALKLQNAARNRMEWFEQVSAHAGLEPLQFSYSLLTSSQRLGHASLNIRDPHFVEAMETWLVGRDSGVSLPGHAIPPMFTAFRLRGLTLGNRVVVAPMAMYSCADGIPGDFHRVHLGALALGGASLIMSEMTAPLPEGRISPNCAGLWNETQAIAWQRIVAFVHQQSSARIGLQLGHSGPKGSTRVLWEGMDEPLQQGNWPLLGASAIPFGPQNQIPRAMTRADMDHVRDAFVGAAKLAVWAGFDLLELHCAHGYLLSSFLSPLTNRRTDAYGGSVENRCRYPLEVFDAIRAVWPDDKPISIRISAVDWAPGGNTLTDALDIAHLFATAGADLIDVSSGLTSREAKPIYGRLFQTPFSDLIRNQVGVATMAVGNISTADEVNTIIAAGRADLCAIGRPHLADPQWTNRAAALLGYASATLPTPYGPGHAQLATALRRQETADRR